MFVNNENRMNTSPLVPAERTAYDQQIMKVEKKEAFYFKSRYPGQILELDTQTGYKHDSLKKEKIHHHRIRMFAI